MSIDRNFSQNDLVHQMRDSIAPGDFRNYIMGFMLYRFLSERMTSHADRLLEKHEVRFSDLRMTDHRDRHILDVLKKDAIKNLGYYIGPTEIFETVATRGTQPGAVFLAELTDILVEMHPIIKQDIEARIRRPVLASMKNIENNTNTIIKEIMNHLEFIAVHA